MLNTKGVSHSSQIMSGPKSILKNSKYNDNGIGYNPNEEIENEYIENLLKQVHFMNLEIKLLKEKGEDNRNRLGISGFLQQDGKQLVDHVILSKDKYQQMKTQLNNQLVTNHDLLQDLSHQFQVEENRKNYLEEQMHSLRDQIKTDDDQFQDKIKEFLGLGQKEKEEKEKLEENIVKVERQMKDIEEEYKRSILSEKESEAFKRLDEEQKKEEEGLEKLMEGEEMKVIEELKGWVEEEERGKRDDLEY